MDIVSSVCVNAGVLMMYSALISGLRILPPTPSPSPVQHPRPLDASDQAGMETQGARQRTYLALFFPSFKHLSTLCVLWALFSGVEEMESNV